MLVTCIVAMACTLLNQIFYDVNKFDVQPTSIDSYMLSQAILSQFAPKVREVEVSLENEHEMEEEKVISKPKEERVYQQLFSPKESDKLFWGIYCLHMGMDEYMMLGTKHKNIELTEKQKLVDYIGKNKSLLKELAQKSGLKLSNVKLQHIESSVMIDRKTSWYVFWVLCAFYKRNALIIQDNVVMQFHIDNEYDTHLFTRDEQGRISVDFAPMTTEDMTNVRSKKWLFDPFRETLLKGMSAYKVAELEEMISLLGLHCEVEKPKKIDLYNCVLIKLDSLHLLQN